MTVTERFRRGPPSVVVVVGMRILLLLAGLLSFVLAAASASENSVTFTLYDNGSSQNGVNVSLTEAEYTALSSGDADDKGTPPGEAFAVSMSSRIDVSKYRAPKPVLATRAFREDGELVWEFEQLTPAAGADGGEGALRRVYLVAEGLEFVWPYVELGHKQLISAKVVPPKLWTAGPVVLESVGDSPRVFKVHNIASEDEAQAIINTALNATSGNGKLKRSTVGSGTDADGKDRAREDSGRTSHNAWDHSSPEAKLLIARSFQITNIEDNDGKRDGLQVVRYTPGQGYNTHPDYFTAKDDGDDFDFNPYSGGSNRFATVFLYLNDPEEGGCTVFPRAPAAGPVMDMPEEAQDMFKKGSWEHTVNKACYTKLAVPPKLGTAALFYSTLPDGRIDPMSHHAACPLIKGTKWGANIWIWNKQRFGDIRTGDPRKVVMKNIAGATVYISWEGRDNGSVRPGGSLEIHSFEYHRFKASFNSHKDKSFAYFTVQSEPKEEQVWKIERPRRYENTSNEQDTSKKKVLVVSNALESIVEIWYGGKFFQSMKPDESSRITTFPGHTFDAAIDDEMIAAYTVKEEPAEQSWHLSRKIGTDDDNDSGDGGYDGEGEVVDEEEL